MLHLGPLRNDSRACAYLSWQVNQGLELLSQFRLVPDDVGSWHDLAKYMCQVAGYISFFRERFSVPSPCNYVCRLDTGDK